MTEAISAIFGFLTVATPIGVVVGAVIAWRKLGPEMRQLTANTRRTVLESALAEDSADDEHFRTMIATQAEFILAPLKAEVERQGRKLADQDTRINELEGQVKSFRRRYRLALDTLLAHIRHNLTIVRLIPADVAIPPPPLVPNEIAEDF